jgi:hypothetical protein
MMSTRYFTLITAFALFVAACGPTDDRDDFDADAPVAAAPGDQTLQGEGRLTLDTDTYDFAVEVCDFSGETDDDMIQTLVGTGQDADGEPFRVYASRNVVNDILVHTISFQQGDVRRGEGRVIEAQRMRMGETWNSVRGGVAAPLIEIDGDRLTATGRFSPDDDLDDTVDGRLEATCRSQ